MIDHDKNHILVISPAFAPYSGVGANRMVSLVNYLKGKYSVTVVRNHATDDEKNYTAIAPECVEYYDVFIKNDDDFKQMESLYENIIKRVVSEKKYMCSIVSVGPYYTFCLVRILRDRRIPVVLDFRDLFAYETRRYDGLQKELRRLFFHKRFSYREKEAVLSASATVFVTEHDIKTMREHYPQIMNNSYLIMNGYDEERILLSTKNASDDFILDSDFFHIGVFGKLSTYNKNLFRLLVKSLVCLRKQGKRIQIIHIGIEEPEAREVFRQEGIQDSYIFLVPCCLLD